MKLVKAYLAFAACVAVAVSVAGAVIIVNERTQLISEGESESEQVFLSQSNRLSDSSGEIAIEFDEIKNTAEQIFSLAPPPVNQIYWICKNIKACF